MSRNKRLFLFAGYDKDGIVDDALVYYIAQLSKCGDVIVCMDCDCQKSELKKLKPYTIHTIATRHGEYDFGSYKHGFQFAVDNNLLNNYDILYLVNDSVFGPLFDIEKTLNNIESVPSDATGLIVATHKTHSYMESWFIKLNKKIFMSIWFNDFMRSITKQPSKTSVTIQYEHGLSNLVKKNSCSFDGLYKYHGRFTYNNPKYLFKHGCPFVKKACFTRHYGAYGNQIRYILNHVDNVFRKSANRIYGEQYMKKFLTSNPLKILYRNIKYGITKLINGKI